MKKQIRVELVFCDFADNPRELASRFKIEATDFRAKGIVPAGKRHPAKQNSFSIESRLPEESALDLHILDILERVPDAIREVENIQIFMCAYIYIKKGDASPISAVHISKNTLLKLSGLSCELDFDIYGYEHT